MKTQKVHKKFIALLLCIMMIVGNANIAIADDVARTNDIVIADDIVAADNAVASDNLVLSDVDNPDLSIQGQLFGLAFHRYHYIDENGKEVEHSQHCTSEEDIKETGILIKKRMDVTGPVIDLEIDALRNAEYMRCKPVLIWLHKGDDMFDATKYTDIDKWYDNKLANGTLLLTVIDSNTTEYKASIGVKANMKGVISSLLQGGYWEVEFYSEDAIPEKLRFAYEAQTMTEQELDEYIKENNIRLRNEWFNLDTGFRPETDGFPFYNVDEKDKGGKCAGYSALSIMKFMKLKPILQDEMVLEYDWADVFYGDATMDDLVLESMEDATPSLNIDDRYSKDGYLLADYEEIVWKPKKTENGEYDLTDSETAFFSMLEEVHNDCNSANSVIASVVNNDAWYNVELICGKLSEGIPVIISPIADGGGHALVAYKSEMISKDTVRIYVYDCNRPDDYIYRHYYNDDGVSIGTAWVYSEDEARNFNYVDFTKVEVEEYIGNYKYDESYVFEFDSTNTSFEATSDEGAKLKCVFVDGNGGIQYINNSNSRRKTLISCTPKYTLSGNTASVRLFGLYNSEEIYDITNEYNTHLEVDLSYLGQYKISDNKIILKDTNKQFTDKNTGEYIEFLVVHSTKDSKRGEIRCRLYIEDKK